MKGLTLLAVCLTGAFLAWYTLSPGRAVDALYEAVQTGDSEQIERMVDFERLRTNLKTDLRDYTARRGDESDSPLASLGVMIGTALVDGLVDTFVSPEGMATLLRGRVPGPGQREEATTTAEPEYDIDRHGLSRFDARIENDDTEAATTQPVLVFERDGLRWRVVRIRLETGDDD